MRASFGMSHLATGIALLLLHACGGAASEAEPKPCERLLEHLVDVSVGDIALDVRAQHRAALHASLGTFVETCASSLSDTQVACALEAQTPAAITSCTR